MREKAGEDTRPVPDDSYLLEPGYIYFTERPVVIKTVVANCVAVCLWDRTRKFGGMNHFVRPSTKDRSKATACFGNVAILALVRMMAEAGCERGDLLAQIFGGAVPQADEGNDVGPRNVKVARDALARQDIAVLSEDVGGAMGRKIVFDTSTGETVVMKVHNVRDADWIAF